MTPFPPPARSGAPGRLSQRPARPLLRSARAASRVPLPAPIPRRPEEALPWRPLPVLGGPSPAGEPGAPPALPLRLQRDALGGGAAARRPGEVRQSRQGPGPAGSEALRRGRAALQLPGLHRRADRQRARRSLRRLLRQVGLRAGPGSGVWEQGFCGCGPSEWRLREEPCGQR